MTFTEHENTEDEEDSDESSELQDVTVPADSFDPNAPQIERDMNDDAQNETQEELEGEVVEA